MTRRVSLPGADELFRSTAAPASEPAPVAVAEPVSEPAPAPGSPLPPPARLVAAAPPVDAGSSQREPDSADEPDDSSLAPPPPAVRRRPRSVGERRPTGRERHDEKITVYCSAEELIDLERARLTLRGDFGIAVDRGRIVREAIALVLADLEAKGEQSVLVRRLRGR